MGHDLISVGGGLAGAALAKTLAEAGARVLVLERETAFKDRVRGEAMFCWGVAEARALGILKLLEDTCAREVRHLLAQIAGVPDAPRRDLVETSPHRVGMLSFYHPQMQATLLAAAEKAGATVRRGATVIGGAPGCPVTVRTREDGAERAYHARLVVAADGRDSGCRKWAGFAVRRDPACMTLAGLFFERLRAPEDRIHLAINPPLGRFALTVPLGGGRFRAQVGVHRQGQLVRLSGRKAVADFVAASIAAGMPAAQYDGAEPAGPLACFEGADHWVDHPYRRGVALIGDAAAASDPDFGCGLSLALRDVRVLRDRLLADPDWDRAAHAYAEEHDRYYGAIHRLTSWMRPLLYDPSPTAAACRARAFPRLAEDGERLPDTIGLGPEAPSDEAARRRLFGED
jgi:2-polyprenyl-6-methoxyphenol hydroxylase-like FAD-dependent oxidoreductase